MSGAISSSRPSAATRSPRDGERLDGAGAGIEGEDLAAGEDEIGVGHGAYSTIATRALATAAPSAASADDVGLMCQMRDR